MTQLRHLAATQEENDDLKKWKFIMAGVCFISSFVIFFPFSSCCRRKKDEVETEEERKTTYKCKNRCI